MWNQSNCKALYQFLYQTYIISNKYIDIDIDDDCVIHQQIMIHIQELK